jgi:Uma2 family endonuclease
MQAVADQAMSSTPTLISLSEYLSTSYRPDCDYVDGEVRERNVGESEHSILQAAIVAWFWNHQQEWGIEVRPEQRVQISPTRFRVPDMCLIEKGSQRGPILTAPPLVCIELLSRSDTVRSLRERVTEYLAFGTEHVWILDPAACEAFICTQGGMNSPNGGDLRVTGTPIFLPLQKIFAALE